MEAGDGSMVKNTYAFEKEKLGVNTPLPAGSHAGGLVSSVADESDRNF